MELEFSKTLSALEVLLDDKKTSKPACPSHVGLGVKESICPSSLFPQRLNLIWISAKASSLQDVMAGLGGNNNTITKREDETLSLPSNTSSQSTNKFSQWIYSEDPPAPIWAPSYSDTPSSTTSEAFFGPKIDEMLNPYNEKFEDAMAWERWDIWEELGSKGGDRVIHGLDSQYTCRSHVGSMSSQDTIITDPTPKPHAPISIYNGRYFAVLEGTLSTPTKDKNPCMSGVETDKPSSRSAASSMSQSRIYPTDAEFPEQEALAAKPSRVKFTTVQDPDDNCSWQTNFSAAPYPSKPSAPPRSGINRSSRSPVELRNHRRSQNRGQSHDNAEKNYRARMDNQFSDLLLALPGELVSRGSKGINGAKSLSKADTMSLAIYHVKSLEKEHKKLEQTSLELRGQIGWYENLFARWRAEDIP